MTEPNGSNSSRPRATLQQRRARAIEGLQQIAAEERKKITRGKIQWGGKLIKYAEKSDKLQLLMRKLYEEADERDKEPLYLACTTFNVSAPSTPSVSPATTDRANQTANDGHDSRVPDVVPSATGPSAPRSGAVDSEADSTTSAASTGTDVAKPSGSLTGGAQAGMALVAPRPNAPSSPTSGFPVPASMTKTAVVPEAETKVPTAAMPTISRSE